ncbi:MAG: glycosyl hydrolase family 28 protein [Tepidisphaeraceae bacterium]|jgi:polygalacturonase
MCIVNHSLQNRWKCRGTGKASEFEKQPASRRFALKRLHLAAGMVLLVPGAFAMAQTANWTVTTPYVPSTDYNITVSNPNIDGGAVATVGANDTAVINDFLAYAAAHGGGTVEVPDTGNGVFKSNEMFIGNNTNLQVDTGAELLNNVPKDVFLTNLNTTQQNVEISGGGTLNGGGSSGNNHMILLQNVSNLEVYNVTITNASNEHLVVEGDNNVLINDITISQPGEGANTDGIDFSGTNFLIENCNIDDGDDDIVAKPENTHCANIYIQNISITNGHGISIGGQTNMGLNGMFVNNVTINMASPSNENGFDFKAGDGTGNQYGGLVQNVTVNNASINDVDDGINISSFYNTASGDNSFPGKDAPAYTPDSTEPIWKDITFENIAINDTTSNSANISGENVVAGYPPNTDELNFVNITGTNVKNPWDMYFASDVYINNLTQNGVMINDVQGNYKPASGGNEVSEEDDDTFDGTENPVYTANVPTLVAATVPEPASVGIIGTVMMVLLPRRNRGPGGMRRAVQGSSAQSP